MGTVEPAREILERDEGLRARLEALASLDLPDAWIGAGALRNRVWDALHRRAADADRDLDVAYFDPRALDPMRDRELERVLDARAPGPWSVKNQARMHERHGHAPYDSALHAIGHWVETATAIAARIERDRLVLCAPHGLEDLEALVVRPVPAYRARLAIFHARYTSKRWLARWPRLRVRV